MSSKIVERVKKVLYEADPMNTYCNLNDFYDEYEVEAQSIVASLNGVQSTRYQATLINGVFQQYFNSDLEPQVVEDIIDAYRK